VGVEDMGWVQVCRKMKSDPGRIPERGDADSVTGRAYKRVTKCETFEGALVYVIISRRLLKIHGNRWSDDE
jgi:hypothetical protein